MGFKRTYRKATSRKRILNITSVKKQNIMLPVTGDYISGQLTPGPLQVGTGFTSMFAPLTLRQSDQPDQSCRNTTTVFMRGYKERLNISLGSGGVWSWRRIVFSLKGPALRDLLPVDTWNGGWDTVNDFFPPEGYPANTAYRLLTPMPDAVRPEVEDFIFRGQRGIDWYDTITAPVDKRHVTLRSDRTRSFCPGNETGKVVNLKLWYPLNKNLMYNDEEVGDATVGIGYSTNGRVGMGDLYILDIARLETPAAAGTASIKFAAEGTVYWHER